MSAVDFRPTRSEVDSILKLPNNDDASSYYRTDYHNTNRRSVAPSTAEMAASTSAPTTAQMELSITQKMMSATWGSVLTSVLATPLDVVRVRLQSQASPPSPVKISKFPAYSTSFRELPPNLGVTACCREVFWVGDNAQFCMAGSNAAALDNAAADCAVEETRRRTFNSTFDGLRKIARNEGIFSLWRGLTPTLAMAIPANVIYFAGYDWLRVSPKSPIARTMSDTYAPLVAGSIARITAASVISPIEMFRTRLQATPGKGTGHFKATLTGLREMVKVEGYTSLWRGLTLTMWRDVPFSGLYWWGYETIRGEITQRREETRGRRLERVDGTQASASKSRPRSREDHTNTFIDSFTAGAMSGAVASLVTTPFDVGKTRQQVFRHETPVPKTSTSSAVELPPEQRSMPRFLYHIWKEEGLQGLFRGSAARCLKVAPACAIMISSYEIGKKMAMNSNEKRAEHERASL